MWTVLRVCEKETNRKTRRSGMAKGSMREQMPVVTAWIDGMRAAFGTEAIDRQIKAGMRGEPVFYASENGHTVGTKPRRGWRVLKDERGNSTRVVEGDGK
jgi:hypothetical protein